MLFDNVRITLTAGNGGNGCVSFHREKYVSHGGPDGGDGGRGGSIIFRIDEGMNTLTYYKYKRKFKAENGGDGAKKKFHGKNGEDLILPVPPGTIIKDAESGLVIQDMSTVDEYRICKGGKGGWGNKHFATPTRQIPRFAKAGIEGEEKEVILELKLIADVGFVGLPNVGKSSLLSAISAARPKVADYHFTTLEPSIGVVELSDERAFVAADMPGLIEGASYGLGLGHEFLRHVDRCRLLIHVVDVSGREGRDPIADIELINNELMQYSPELASRKQIIAANKIDLVEDESDLDAFRQYADEKGYLVVYISAVTGKNVKTLVETAYTELTALPPIKVYEAEYVEETFDDPTNHDFTVKNVNGVFVVEGDWLYRVMGNINFGDRESLMYFQRVLRNNGVIKALEEKGATDGDTVFIYDFEFDFVT
ncbi:MAG: GTPase ObgE [Clostridia bacterium]|nr:GTPase ObgE [Clostridia bacterium]